MRRVGITFTAAQEQVLKYGNESQRAAMLAEVITDNVGHMNAELAKTDAGKAQQMANAIGDIKEVVGSWFESIEPAIAAVNEFGMALMGIGSMITGIKSVKAALVLFTSKIHTATIATYANAAASKVAAAAQFLWAKQLHYGRKANIAWAFSARLAATQAVAMRAAILGLMAASGVGLALMAVSAIVSLFSDKTDEATESMKAANREMANAEEAAKRLEDMERAMSEARAGAVSSLELYKERLKNLIAMKNTGKDTTKEEKKIIGELNDTYGETMGYFDSVSKWYEALIKNSEAYCRQMVIEARMRQLANQIAEKEAENHSIIYDDKGNKRRYSRKRETEIIDEWGVDRDGNRVLAKHEVKEKKGSSDLDKAVQKLKDNSAVIKNLQSQMSASAKEAGQIVIPVKGSSVRPGTGGHATPKATPQKKAAAPAVEGSMDWYEQRLAELRKQLRAAADEETARALQADYKATEQEYADLKVSISVEAPDKAEADTALDKLRAAQRELDDAVTVEAKVEASAKADDIQARIDEATRGRLTIGADVEPSYIAKGSAADLRQSYQNAQARATRIQQDYEIGLIGKDKALADIAEINLALEKLGDNGMKPIEIGVMTEDADKAGKSLQDATAAIGSMGQALSGLGGAIEMPELNIAGTVAQAVATMALGFAKDDGTMRTRNWWRVGDQAKCQTMNIDRPVSADADGTPLGWRAPRTGNAGNRYYWRLVTAVGTETLDDGREYDWVELSNERAVTLAGADGGAVECVGYDTTFDGGDADGMKWHADANDAPMAGDEIVQQGSQTDPGRQHLILLAAVGERAPSIEEYAGVGRSDGPGPYSLTGRCMTSMSPRSGNMFRARRFEIETDGGAVRVPCHRGAWQAGIRYSYYDQVGHAGGLWLCVAPGGTESEPGHGGGWEQQVAPGKDGTPGRDGADNAVRAWLSPVSLVATETAPGVFELSESVLALNVVRGTGDDITGECRLVSARGMGCTASVDGVDTVEVTGATGDGGTIAVVAGVALPGGGVVECRADYAINRLGTFRETIENDVKRQVAQREFAYSDAYGRQHTVAGMSAVAQSAEQVRQEVWRRQPAGSVVANGTFADGLERWSVEGGVVAAWWQGVPCARLTPAGAATALHQSAADMACDWGSLGVGKDGVPLRARVSMRVATDGGCRLRVGLEGSGVDVEAVDVEAGGWLTVAIGGTGGVALSRAPSELVVALERGECRVTDIQVVPDVAVMVGTRLTQTADGIAMLVGGMAKGLQATGIDIANRKVTVTADSFMVMNNRGEATAAVDADGNLVAGSLKAGGKAGGKAGVAMGIDGEGKPYLVGTNARGEVVWRLDGNGYVNSTPDVAMAVAGGRAYFANRMDGGYDIRYEVGVRVTNRQLAQVTFTPGGHLGCYIQKSRTEQSAWVALAQKEAVAIASGASGVVTFSGASTVGGSRGAAPAVPFGNGDTLDVRLCYKGEGRGVGLVTCGLET